MDNPFSLIDERLENIENQLAQLLSTLPRLSENKSENDVVEECFNIEELAAYLGVAKTTIFRYKRNRVFPFYQAGRTVYFKRYEIDQALSSSKKKR